MQNVISSTGVSAFHLELEAFQFYHIISEMVSQCMR